MFFCSAFARGPDGQTHCLTCFSSGPSGKLNCLLSDGILCCFILAYSRLSSCFILALLRYPTDHRPDSDLTWVGFVSSERLRARWVAFVPAFARACRLFSFCLGFVLGFMLELYAGKLHALFRPLYQHKAGQIWFPTRISDSGFMLYFLFSYVSEYV